MKPEFDFAGYLSTIVSYFQSLTTISAALLALIPSFLDKAFEEPIWRWLLIFASFGLLGTVIASSFGQRGVAFWAYGLAIKDDASAGWGTRIFRNMDLLSWGLFSVGMTALALFSVINFLKSR
jgi:hypothetical protein